MTSGGSGRTADDELLQSKIDIDSVVEILDILVSLIPRLVCGTRGVDALVQAVMARNEHFNSSHAQVTEASERLARLVEDAELASRALGVAWRRNGGQGGGQRSCEANSSVIAEQEHRLAVVRDGMRCLRESVSNARDHVNACITKRVLGERRPTEAAGDSNSDRSSRNDGNDRNDRNDGNDGNDGSDGGDGNDNVPICVFIG